MVGDNSDGSSSGASLSSTDSRHGSRIQVIVTGKQSQLWQGYQTGLMAMVEKLVSKSVVQVVVTGVHLLLQCSAILRLKEHTFLSGIANNGKVCLVLIFWLRNLAAQA